MTWLGIVPSPQGNFTDVGNGQVDAESTNRLVGHLPKNPMCENRRRAKTQFPHHRSIQPQDKTKHDHFGQMVTGDHLRLTREDSLGIVGELAGILFKDLHTGQL